MKTFQVLNLIFICLVLSLQSFGRVVIINGLTHTHSGMKGSVIQGKIMLKNDGKKETRVLIYRQDLIMNCETSFDYQDINKHDRSMGDWLKTNVDEKILQPNEEYDITYTITIPNELKQNGTYWAAIMVEGAEPLTEEKKGGVTIGSKVRYAINILSDVGTFENSKLIFENINLKKSDSTVKIIQVKLRNNGNFVNRTKLNVEIYDKNGTKVKIIEGIYRRVYPEKCNDFEIEVRDLPKGKYDGVIIADSGKDLFGTNITIDIE